jgi:hypothetical protein
LIFRGFRKNGKKYVLRFGRLALEVQSNVSLNTQAQKVVLFSKRLRDPGRAAAGRGSLNAGQGECP